MNLNIVHRTISIQRHRRFISFFIIFFLLLCVKYSYSFMSLHGKLVKTMDCHLYTYYYEMRWWHLDKSIIVEFYFWLAICTGRNFICWKSFISGDTPYFIGVRLYSLSVCRLTALLLTKLHFSHSFFHINFLFLVYIPFYRKPYFRLLYGNFLCHEVFERARCTICHFIIHTNLSVQIFEKTKFQRN